MNTSIFLYLLSFVYCWGHSPASCMTSCFHSACVFDRVGLESFAGVYDSSAFICSIIPYLLDEFCHVVERPILYCSLNLVILVVIYTFTYGTADAPLARSASDLGITILPHRLEGRTRLGLVYDLKGRARPNFLVPDKDNVSALRDGSLSCHLPVQKEGFSAMYEKEQVEPVKYFMQLSQSTPNIVFSVTSRWNGRGGCPGLNCDICLAD